MITDADPSGRSASSNGSLPPLDQLREVVVHARHAENRVFVPERAAQIVKAVLPAIGDIHDWEAEVVRFVERAARSRSRVIRPRPVRRSA